MDDLYHKCVNKAEELIIRGYVGDNMGLFKLTDLLYKMELEKRDKDAKSDKNINYNDEIISIEAVGDKETIDISVTGDNLFYCNGILTKNSWGLPATVDFMIAAISTEELESLGQLLIKQLKNRWGDPTLFKRFVIGVDRARMKLFDVEQSAQDGIQHKIDDTPVMDNSAFGAGLKRERKNIFDDWK
jgi:hypothetical protein